MKKLIIKVCGMRDNDNINEVAALGVDWIGMIFYKKSPRYVKMASALAGIIPDKAESYDSHHPTLVPQSLPLRVGVFVDEMAQGVITRAVNFKLDIIQLHGKETPTFIRNLRRTLDPDIRPGIRIIKAISVKSREDIATYKKYENCVDYFLFDTQCKTVGGSGQQFDWSVLDDYDGDKPFLLSGGVGPDDAERIRQFNHPKLMGIDLNSRFETAPALKDIEKLRNFIEQIKKQPIT